MSEAVNTKQVGDRRILRFDSIDACIAEVERIMDADREGYQGTLGNWTPSQNFTHVAAWIDSAYDGYPIRPAPWIVRLFLKFQVRKILRTGMKPGISIPGVPGGTTGAEDIPLAEAGDRLIRALRRLASVEPAKYTSPAFGVLPDEDRRQGMLRHAELHPGFLVPAES